MKTDPVILIRQLTIYDHRFFSTGIALLNRTQGQGLYGPKYLESSIENSQSCLVGAFVTTTEKGADFESIVGLGIVKFIESYDYYLPFDPNIVNELKHKKVGSFSTLSVDETYQGIGIGQKLSQMRLVWAKTQKCDVILGVSWVSGLSHTSDRVFEKLGFKAVSKVKDFFKESSIQNPFDCPGCKSAPCNCAAVLYRLDL